MAMVSCSHWGEFGPPSLPLEEAHELPNRVRNALLNDGIFTTDQLLRLEPYQLKGVPGLGEWGVRVVKDFLRRI
jgi:hypothetical protein